MLDNNADRVVVVRRYGNDVHYGDATRPELLEAAGAEHAQLLVLAVSDIESTMHIIERAQKHFPHLRIFARARNRHQAQLLKNAGIHYFQRELLPASLETSREVLVGLGITRDRAQRAVDIFRPHDEQLMSRQLEVSNNQRQLIQTVQEAYAELERVYAADEDIVAELKRAMMSSHPQASDNQRG